MTPITEQTIEFAKERNFPDELIEWLSQNMGKDLDEIEIEFKCEIALDPKTPLKKLRELSIDPNGYVKFCVLMNPKTTPAMILPMILNSTTISLDENTSAEQEVLKIFERKFI